MVIYISDMSGNIHNQMSEKATHFHSVALNDSTDSTDTAKLAIHVCAVNDNFDVMEQLLTITNQEIFRKLSFHCGCQLTMEEF